MTDNEKDHDKNVEATIDQAVMTDEELDEVAGGYTKGGYTKLGDTYTSSKRRR